MSIDITSKNFSNYTKRLQKTLAKELGSSTPLSLSQCSELLAKTLGFNTCHDLKKVITTPEEEDKDFQAFERHRLAIENEIQSYFKNNLDTFISDVTWCPGFFIENGSATIADICLTFTVFHSTFKCSGAFSLSEINEKDFQLTEKDRSWIAHLKSKLKKDTEFNTNFNFYIRNTYNLSRDQHAFVSGNSGTDSIDNYGVGIRSYWIIPKTQFDNAEKRTLLFDRANYFQLDDMPPPELKLYDLKESLSIIKQNQHLMAIKVDTFDAELNLGLYIFYRHENKTFMGRYNSTGLNKVEVEDLEIEPEFYYAYLIGCSDYMLGFHDTHTIHTNKNLNYFYLKGYLYAKSWFIKQPRF